MPPPRLAPHIAIAVVAIAAAIAVASPTPDALTDSRTAGSVALGAINEDLDLLEKQMIPLIKKIDFVLEQLAANNTGVCDS